MECDAQLVGVRPVHLHSLAWTCRFRKEQLLGRAVVMPPLFRPTLEDAQCALCLRASLFRHASQQVLEESLRRHCQKRLRQGGRIVLSGPVFASGRI